MAGDTEEVTRAVGEPEAAYRTALDAAVRSLGRREHGRQELVRKLVGKGHAPALVDRVMAYLAEHDLQSDDRFAEGFVRSRVQKGYGPVKIRQELASRGVDEEALERQLTEPADYWLDIARRALVRKFGQDDPRDREHVGAPPGGQDGDEAEAAAGEDPRRAWNARARFLARRGFPADLIYRVLGADRG